jgi:hypothetical protein
LDLGGSSIPVNLTIRAEQQKYIWFSANAMGLVEVARGRIDKDSVRVVDKFNNRCYVGGMDGLGAFLPIPLEIKQLQHFLMGKVFWDSLATGKLTTVGDSSLMQGEQSETSFFAKIYKKYNLTTASARILPSNSFINLQNDDFRPIHSSGYLVAFQKRIQSGYPEENGKMKESKVRIEFSKFEFVSEPPDFSFELPSDCIRQVLK